MRILQICSAREIGGGEQHIIDLANSFTRRGHDTFAALALSSPLTRKLTELPNGNTIELPMRNSLNLATARKLARFVRDHQVEVVHAHIARDYPLAALIAGRSGAVFVITRHVLFPLSRIHRLTLRRVSKVIAVSRAVAESLRGRHIFNDEQIVVIHNGIDANRFGFLRARTERLRVGMAGHLAPIKGQEDLIRAAAVICAERNDVEFIIAGEDKSPGGENRRFLERLIDELNLQGRIQLVGWVDDMPGFLSSLDVFVSPARSEPFGLTIVEAMAGGVPVVATMSEGAQEIIDPDITGVMVPIADIKAIADAIRPLLDDQNLASSLSQRARDIVREKFSLERMVDETENVYRSALGYSS